MQFKITDFGKLLKTTAKEWFRKDPFRQSAVIAFYAIFAIPGLLFLIITITGNIFGKEAVIQKVLTQISGTMGADTAAQIEDMLVKVVQAKSTLMGSIIGIVIILVGASGVFVELQKSLNIIWEVEVVPKRGIWPILKARLFSFGILISIAFLLLISLVVSTALAATSDWIKTDASGSMITIFNILNFFFSLIVICLLFALIFKILPDAKIKWKHVWLGSVVTGVLFTIGKTALAFYFGTAHPASGYGVAGSIILILIWVSFSSMIVFFGAEFTAKFANMYSGKVPPTEIAQKESPDKAKKKL